MKVSLFTLQTQSCTGALRTPQHAEIVVLFSYNKASEMRSISRKTLIHLSLHSTVKRLKGIYSRFAPHAWRKIYSVRNSPQLCVTAG